MITEYLPSLSSIHSWEAFVIAAIAAGAAYARSKLRRMDPDALRALFGIFLIAMLGMIWIRSEGAGWAGNTRDNFAVIVLLHASILLLLSGVGSVWTVAFNAVAGCVLVGLTAWDAHVHGGSLTVVLPLSMMAAGYLALALRLFAKNGVPTKAISLGGGASPSSSDNADLPAFPAVKTRLAFVQVVGMEETKARLLDAGKAAMSRVAGEPPRNGILLHGEPGNGKTLFAEALAGELGLRFIKLTYAEAASRWINQTTESVRAAFTSALRQAPCVLFIDEIDSFLADRGAAQRSDTETPRTTNALLTMINDLRGKGVLLVAATNHLDKLDSAGVREGRFDFKIEIPPPDLAAREAILRKTLAKLSVTMDAVAVHRAARRWEGFSASRIAAIGKEVVDQARKSRQASVGFDDLTAALRRLQGSQGDRLSEDTPDISGVFLPGDSSRKLSGIAYRMREIERVEEMGGTLPSGILFYGPPGTGKTLAARALAKSTGWAFLATNGQELLSDSGRLQAIIKRARDIRPVIVFIDEADDVLADRGGSPWSKSTTNDLLTAIDGAKGRVADIVWVAATNHPDALDAAAVRGGRFQEKIRFELPDEGLLAEYIDSWLDGCRASFEDGLDARGLAHVIGRVSLADAKAILQTAVNNMLSAGAVEVEAAHVRAAREEVVL